MPLLNFGALETPVSDQVGLSKNTTSVPLDCSGKCGFNTIVDMKVVWICILSCEFDMIVLHNILGKLVLGSFSVPIKLRGVKPIGRMPTTLTYVHTPQKLSYSQAASPFQP